MDVSTNQHIAKAIARAWTDPLFKARLIADTKAALKECGATIPDNVTMHTVENTETDFYLVLPAAPKDLDLTEVELGDVGTAYWCTTNSGGLPTT